MAACLSLIIPCYNEEATLRRCVERILAIQTPVLPPEIIIVNDASRDKSKGVAEALASANPNIIVIHHAINQGKGAALRTGFAKASGDYVVVQDADLEYNPEDLPRMLAPLQAGKADVVFGSRYRTAEAQRVRYFWHTLINKGLTLFSNMLTNLNLTDMETCYKMMRRDIIQSLTLSENRFGIEPELVAKIAKFRIDNKPLRIFEVAIDYHGRTRSEGKKIGIRDAFRAVYCIVKYNL